MRKYLTPFLFVFMIYNLVSAKDESGYNAKTGDQALLFNLKGLSDLKADNFKGGLGYQYYFMNHAAFRLGVGVSYENQSLDKTAGAAKDYKLDDLTLTFTPGIRYNFASSSNVLAYMGAEAIVAISDKTEEGVDFKDIKKTSKSAEYGLGLFIGAEWFAFKNVSLSAEYSLQGLYSNGSTELTNSTSSVKSDTPDKFKVGLGASPINFTISFYFN
jgi:outer membrane protein W